MRYDVTDLPLVVFFLSETSLIQNKVTRIKTRDQRQHYLFY